MTQESKQIAQLTLQESKGLAITILRDEFGYKWDYIARVMNMARSSCDRYYKQFNKIYTCTENENLTEENVDPGSGSLSSTQLAEEESGYDEKSI